MKTFGKIFALGLVSLVSLSAIYSTQKNTSGLTEVLKKEKPKPVYEFNQDTKTFKFVDAVGEYRVNNMHWDVVKEGKIESKNVELNLSSLAPGEYIVEIEHKGYVFIEDIFL